MANPDQTALINHDRTNDTTTLSVGMITLDYGKKLTINIGTGYPTTASMSITKVDFWNVDNGQKGTTHKGTWNRTGTSSVPPGVTVSKAGTNDTGVELKDSDTGDENDDYYYNVTAHDSSVGGKDYTADPELLLKKQVKPPTGGTQPTADPGPDRMADYEGTINYHGIPGKAKLDFGTLPRPITLDYGDTLTIYVGTGFPNESATNVGKTSFWNSEHGHKGSVPKGKWIRGGPNNPPAGLSIAEYSTAVRFTDIDTAKNEDYYFNVSAIDTSDNDKAYRADPEIVVRKRNPTTTRSRTATGPELEV